jgi:hypothetical protein
VEVTLFIQLVHTDLVLISLHWPPPKAVFAKPYMRKFAKPRAKEVSNIQISCLCHLDRSDRSLLPFFISSTSFSRSLLWIFHQQRMEKKILDFAFGYFLLFAVCSFRFYW